MRGNSFVDAAATRWAEADRGWRAVAVGAAVTLLVGLGVPVPW